MSLFFLLNQPLNATLFILPLVPLLLLRHSLLLVPRRLLFRHHLTLNPQPLFIYSRDFAALKRVKEVSGLMQNETEVSLWCLLHRLYNKNQELYFHKSATWATEVVTDPL